jgi:hypothetical protein
MVKGATVVRAGIAAAVLTRALGVGEWVYYKWEVVVEKAAIMHLLCFEIKR